MSKNNNPELRVVIAEDDKDWQTMFRKLVAQAVIGLASEHTIVVDSTKALLETLHQIKEEGGQVLLIHGGTLAREKVSHRVRNMRQPLSTLEPGDVLLIASGYIQPHVRRAMEELVPEGVQVRIVDKGTLEFDELKPFLEGSLSGNRSSE